MTIDENGTGYYLVQAASASEPSVAAVLAGSSIALTANVAGTATIGGLTGSTSYKVYFVARMRPVTSRDGLVGIIHHLDVTPSTTVGLSASDTTGTGTTLTVTIDENGTGYYLVQASLVLEPSVAAVLAGSSIALKANVAATATINGLPVHCYKVTLSPRMRPVTSKGRPRRYHSPPWM